MLYQQGDVLFRKVDSLPEKVEKAELARRGKKIILVEGEATGHAHVATTIYEDVDFVRDEEGNLFMKVPPGRTVTIRHDKPDGKKAEHNTLILEEGIYQVDQVQERDHWAENNRRVFD